MNFVKYRAELLFQCQQKVFLDQMGHPVKLYKMYFINLPEQVLPRFLQLRHVRLCFNGGGHDCGW